jgi:hypothetical protein
MRSLRTLLSALALAVPLPAACLHPLPTLAFTPPARGSRSAALRCGRPVLQGGGSSTIAADWSFLDAVYVITCPSPDGSNPRLAQARTALSEVGLNSLVEVREFQPDNEDRVRGCYTSHIAVLEEAEKQFEGKESLNVMVIEDNLSLSPRLCGSTLESVATFLRGDAPARDVMHLAYIMYVPGLSVSRVEENIVLLKSSIDSVLGTTAYVITRSGLDAVLQEHRRTGYAATAGGKHRPPGWRAAPPLPPWTTRRRGARLRTPARRRSSLEAHPGLRSSPRAAPRWRRRSHLCHLQVDAIPNVMARLFPDSRFAAYPMPFHRAAAVKSLVNGQLDSLRALLFKPEIYTQWERRVDSAVSPA